MPLVKGTTLSTYAIGTELGSGGMGKVYKATVVESNGLEVGTPVALKVIHAHLLEKSEFVERFKREVKAGQAVVHENVVRTYDSGTANSDKQALHYLVMEYVEGQTLGALVRELGRVPEELCRALSHDIWHILYEFSSPGASCC